MKRITAFVLGLVIVINCSGQKEKRIAEVDSIIADNTSKTILISSIMAKSSIVSSHGNMNWNVSQVIKYRYKYIPVEVQKIWVDRDQGCDTFQVKTYYFDGNEQIKFNLTYYDPGKPIYCQNIYFEKGLVVSAIDSEGVIIEPKSYLINVRRMLKKIKRLRKTWISQ